MISTSKSIPLNCFHCGDVCNDTSVAVNENYFCCEGCKQVYLLLNENNLCSYYDLDKTPGIKAKGKFLAQRFAYLDDEAIIQKLVHFQGEEQINVTFSIPQMHCSSCVYLLENLHRIEPGVKQSQVNFQLKEIFIIFNPKETTLRKVVELLAFTGYEPYISLQDSTVKNEPAFNRRQIYKIGVAGFCFANIMMLSFPEYFSSGNIDEKILKQTFNWVNLALSVPVLFFSASDIFLSAWKGLRQKFLNIDAPIALAIIVTFARSYFEIVTGYGAGYLDSGTGIVFFMLVGRWFQNKTYDSFSFDRDYRSYFPLGVTLLEHGAEKNIPVTRLQKNNRILVRNEEMIPADSVLIKGIAHIDYSFVSGENTAVEKRNGELIYAGGKQKGSAIELEIIKEPSQSYITQLWNNNDVFTNKKNQEQSFIHPWSRYFTLVLLSIAAATFIYWSAVDVSKILPAVTAVLIVACPCSLLLSATFTYGNMLRIYGRNKLYLKNATVIEALAKINTVVFDKTGTLTQTNTAAVHYEGLSLSVRELNIIKNAARQSSHPLSKLITSSIKTGTDIPLTINSFKEYTGKGLEAVVDDLPVKMGSAGFIKTDHEFVTQDTGTSIHVVLDNVQVGKFSVKSQYRQGINEMAAGIKKNGISMYVLSGDNDLEKNNLKNIFGSGTPFSFNLSPQQKLDFIKNLQLKGSHVLMLGDGLNDAGALMQSQVGIAVSENSAQFSPASDAILDGTKVSLIDRFIAYARAGKNIVLASFILSILYNIVGLSFAVQGALSPMVAAILMPASSISIVLFVSLLSSLVARKQGL